jgi:predicted O-linked N-acetylglucosamine transferase (SPINDLY family)
MADGRGMRPSFSKLVICHDSLIYCSFQNAEKSTQIIIEIDLKLLSFAPKKFPESGNFENIGYVAGY